MSEELDELIENIRQPSVWFRLAFMIAFAVGLYFVLLPVIIVLVIMQALFSVFTGQSNENLRFFAAALGSYVSQVIKFLTYNSETKPFPFSDFPQADDASFSPATASGSANGSQKPAAEKKASAKKAAPRAATGKKTTAKKKSTRKASAGKSESGDDHADSSESS